MWFVSDLHEIGSCANERVRPARDTFQVSRSGHSRSKIAVWQRKFARCGVVGTFVPKARKSTGRDAFLR
jgi:hypothetical protein